MTWCRFFFVVVVVVVIIFLNSCWFEYSPKTTLILQCSSFTTTSAPMPRLPPVITAVRPGWSKISVWRRKIGRRGLFSRNCETKAIELKCCILHPLNRIQSKILNIYHRDCVCVANNLQSSHAHQHIAMKSPLSTVTNSSGVVSMIGWRKIQQMLGLWWIETWLWLCAQIVRWTVDSAKNIKKHHKSTSFLSNKTSMKTSLCK